ncbi:MAG: MFS transporter [Pseudomonadota bacterium]
MRTRWGLVALLFVTGLLAAMQFIKVSLTLDALVATYDRPLQVVSGLVSLVSVMGIVLGVVAGAVVARLGTRQIILGALALGALLSAAQALLPPFPALVGLRALEGISHLALVVAIPPTMAAISSDRDRPVVMSIWAMFFGVAFALSAIVIPPLMDTGGLPLIFLLHAAGLAVCGAALIFLLPPGVRSPQEINFFRAHRVIYSSPRVAAPAIGFVFYTILFLAAVTFIPRTLDRPDLAVSLPLVSLVGTLGAGFLCRRYAPDRVAIIGFAGILISAIPLFFGAVWAAWPLFLAMGLPPGASFAAIPHWNAGERDRALATGAIAQMGNVGTGLGTPIFAFAMVWAGSAGLWWLLIWFSGIGILAVVLMRMAIQRSR